MQNLLAPIIGVYVVAVLGLPSVYLDLANPPSSLETQSTINLLRMVDKNTALSVSYVPSLTEFEGHQVNVAVEKDLLNLLTDARSSGLNLKIISAYRSYQTQVALFNRYAKTYGEMNANTFSARPGHSEHQLGTAIDFGSGRATDLTANFANEPEGEWLVKNAPNYGFILSYPKGSEAVTGYIYEPWHFRYVGIDQAQTISENGLTLGAFTKDWFTKNYVSPIINLATCLKISSGDLVAKP